MTHSEGMLQGFDDVNLFYQCWRPEKKTRSVLAIIHGFGEHSGRYVNVVDHFVPCGYAVYGFDLRGHGRSLGQRGHINRFEEFRGDVAAFVQMIARLEPEIPIFLWAHSLGGMIGLATILHHPQGLHGAIISGPLLNPAGSASPHMIYLLPISRTSLFNKIPNSSIIMKALPAAP
ncbi:MAG: alpha/beta fold hydrolase, partial [Anaerolineae bacterium]|nr:alpha/beta fold hydrolase [Anaerolineae bacterium]